MKKKALGQKKLKKNIILSEELLVQLSEENKSYFLGVIETLHFVQKDKNLKKGLGSNERW